MGLSASLYSGTSGLKAHGEDMTVIGNNISNVSTIGFKGSRMYFEDALSQQITTASGSGQVGRGVSVGTVMGDFSQGSLESTTEATDLAVGGNGFFMVSPAGQEINYYTRAGNFRFDEDGYLVNPQGYRLQGWEVQQTNASASTTGNTTAPTKSGVQIQGVPQDVKLENFQSPPQATARIDVIVNVDSASEDKSAYTTSPFTSLFNAYDAGEASPLTEESYAYQTTIKVYDENGSSHNLTVYMDPVGDENVESEAGGKKYWEYIVTVPPGDDNREFWDGVADPKMKGVLMAGTLTFNAAGELENMSAFTINDTTLPPDTLTSWEPADISPTGYPRCTANFLGTSDGSIVGPLSKNIEINFGLRNKTTTWDPGPAGQNPEASDLGLDNLAALATLDPSDLALINGFDVTDKSALSSTNYSTGSTTIFQAQDGYTAGFLQNISVDRDGVITGRYSNGQVLQLFAVTLATFNNNYALYREGGNLFSETRSSGPPITGLANTGGKGSIASNSLEQSNVDLATEFVKMITTEKGFQANSKTITTVDQMLTVLIQLKR
ncbi:flagellar hook protein FlgE [Desulfomicrobium norvegicum]|uniref:Flagellar hook protein FlgE n=1 Tax=Desulfomicrobium norvegicum (strain DSM 1741 / NCIMB 8310) TaxID=52561 RepID=A0A8G2F382_DESNO|nr:flagellar hook protein FlgE [Desulfomicrobium norvegicum]SFL32924.1 flagellar hook protein FlgE [Desulfomicrobium norvegicum]